MYDVVVVGGGPVGSYAAYKLAGMGYRVVVLEQRESLGEPVCCTGIIGQECVNSFAIDDNLILRRVNSARLFSPSGKLLRLWQQETQAYILDRVAFGVAVASRAQGKGAEYMLNCPVRNVEVGDGKVRVKVARQGERLNFEGRAVVIASGFGYRLVEQSGVGRISHFVMGAQAEVETVGINEVEVYFGHGVAPGFFAWLVPVSPRKARLGLLSHHRPGLYLRRLMLSLVAQGKITSGEAELRYGGVALKPLARTYGERLLVVGSAAGQVKPTTGGGIYYGLLCADIAANNLHRALESNDLSAKGLANYEREWRRKLGRELRIGYWARKLYGRLSDRQIDMIFSIVAAGGMDKALLNAADVSFDWHSGGLLRLLRHRAISKAIEVATTPFRLGGRV